MEGKQLGMVICLEELEVSKKLATIDFHPPHRVGFN